MITRIAAGALVTALSLYAWVKLEQRWIPDTDLYTEGGFGLYPSPLGRALGAMGPDVFAVLSAVMAGVVVWSLNGRARVAAIVLSPVVLYLTFASADVIALGFYALFLNLRRPLWLVLASITHLAMIPYALLHVVATDRLTSLQKCVIGYFVLGAAAAVLWATPYGGIIGALSVTSGAKGLALALLVGAPAVLLFRQSALTKAAFLVGVVECAAQSHAQARYFLPALLLLAATGDRRPLDSIRPLWYTSSYGYQEASTQASGQARAAGALADVQADYTRTRSPRRRRRASGHYRVTGNPLEVRVCNLGSNAVLSNGTPGQGVVASGSSTRHLRRIEEGTLR